MQHMESTKNVPAGSHALSTAVARLQSMEFSSSQVVNDLYYMKALSGLQECTDNSNGNVSPEFHGIVNSHCRDSSACRQPRRHIQGGLLVSLDTGHKILCQLINRLQAGCRVCFLPQAVRLKNLQQAGAAANIYNACILGQKGLHSFTDCPGASVIYTNSLGCFISPKHIAFICKP